MNPLKGIHHVTAITSSAERIYAFFTHVLGYRLVKKTINQDDINTYHLFFADEEGRAGTDMTFFDFPGSVPAINGTDVIQRTAFRVPDDAALDYWRLRFETYAVVHEPIKTLFGVKTLFFKDFDQQAYALVSDQNDTGVASGQPWKKGPVPDDVAITGLGPVFIRVSRLDRMHQALTDKLKMRAAGQEGTLHRYEMGEGGNGASIIIDDQPGLPKARLGHGAVHHVAFRIEDKTELETWMSHLNVIGANHSGLVDRFYFKSLYTRLYPEILFEFATEGPGFIDDEETVETLGETLALPPRFRPLRDQITTLVRHIDTTRSDQDYIKETKEVLERGKR